jgi:hypothetical protein
MTCQRWCGLLAGFIVAQQVVAQPNSETTGSSFSISAGMGVGIHHAPFLVDYLNAYRISQSEPRLDDFSSMLEFFIAPELRVHAEWSCAIEYSVLMKTQTVGASSAAGSEFSYLVHMPTALVHYVVSDPNFFLKFGGGVGYHIAAFQQRLYPYNIEDSFTASGLGFKLEAVGDTKFDETFFGSIGVDLRWDFLGTLKNARGVEAYERTTNSTAKMQFFSASVKFGVMFQL